MLGHVTEALPSPFRGWSPTVIASTSGLLTQPGPIVGETPLILEEEKPRIGGSQQPSRPQPKIVERDAVAEARSHFRKPPYAAMIRILLTDGRVLAARRLLGAALNSDAPPEGLDRLRTLLGPPKIRRDHARDPDRTEEYAWLRSHGHEHSGRWVAVSGGRLVASAGSLRQLLDAIGTKGALAPLIHRIL